MEKAKWTFMAFIAGDNNLDPAALDDIGEMAKVGSSDDLHVLVQLDRAKDRKTRRFRITQGGGYPKDCIESFAETNTGDPKVMEDFILWGMEKYPASRYALVIWNHGGGWWEEPGRPLRNIAYDDTSGGDSLDNRELRDVLAGVAKVKGQKIDILGMDACLMAMAEVAYQLRDSVKVTVGSEEEEPFDGWPYEAVLGILKNRPRLVTAAVAREIVKEYVKSYEGQGEDVTQSAFNLHRIAEVVSGLDALSRDLIAGIEDSALMEAVAAAREASPEFFGGNYIDLYRFLQLLGPRCRHRGIRGKATELLRALRPGKERAIIHQASVGTRLKHTHGMSIYFPASAMNPKYMDLDFAKACAWPEFLEKYLASDRGL